MKLIRAVNSAFLFFDLFNSKNQVNINGENPVNVDLKFKDGKNIDYNLWTTGESGENLIVNGMYILPSNVWTREDEFYFKKTIKKVEKVAKKVKKPYIIIESIDGLRRDWLENMGYEIKGKDRNYLGIKQLK